MTHAVYLRDALNVDDRRYAMGWAKEQVAGLQFEAIAVCGVSGLTIGSMLAWELQKPLVVVRKEDDVHNHSDVWVEVPAGLKEKFAYLIVDDIIGSGATTDRMKMLIPGECVGMLLYHVRELVMTEAGRTFREQYWDKRAAIDQLPPLNFGTTLLETWR